MSSLYYEQRDISNYPSEEDSFNPSKLYPEYMWGNKNISNNENTIYDMVRESLSGLGLDSENFNKKTWNPLGKIIKKNDTVLIKPNMVVSEHPFLDCIITHPSVIRAVVDYACIALEFTGKIIIGDAPMQRCNFDKLANLTGMKKMVEFYGDKGIDISLLDFRNFISDYSTNNVSVLKSDYDADNFVCVDLKKDSLLCPQDKYFKRYRVTNYDYRLMQAYHNINHHKYLIRKEVLNADVIINLPKPKTHRKAGLTGALKNCVGTIVHKECLPHHIRGSIASGGNEYKNRSLAKEIQTRCYEQIDLANIYSNKLQLKVWKLLLNWNQKFMFKKKKDPYFEGSWYGNDTIWRTFGDINRILLYADQTGKMHLEKQRETFIVGDMIVCGEGEGPVHAMPKRRGAIVSGFNAVEVDLLIARIMGFDYKKIPALRNLIQDYSFPLFKSEYNNIVVKSNKKEMDNKNIKDIEIEDVFIPTDGWKNHIELEDV